MSRNRKQRRKRSAGLRLHAKVPLPGGAPPALAQPTALSGQMPRPASSGRYNILSVPTYPANTPQALLPRPREGGAGIYRVTFVLAPPGQQAYRTSLPFAQIMESGDSQLILSADATQLKMRLIGEGQEVELIGLPNQRGALARVQMRVDAQNVRDAQRFATDLVLPILSHWSHHADVGLDVAAIEVHEERTDMTQWTVGILGGDRVLGSLPSWISTAVLRRFHSAYREGMTATNPFHKVLSFAKAFEGVRKQRLAREKRIRATGGEYIWPDERIPPDTADFPIVDPNERRRFDPYFGLTFDDVALLLRKTIRHAVAHVDPEGDSLTADNYDDLAKAEEASPVLQYMAHQVLRHELEVQAGEVIVVPPAGMMITELGDQSGAIDPARGQPGSSGWSEHLPNHGQV